MTGKTKDVPEDRDEPEDKETPEADKQRHFKSGLPAPTIYPADPPAKYELGDGSDPVPPNDPDSGIESDEDRDLDEEAPDDEDNVPTPQRKPPAPRPKAKTPGKTW